MPTLLLALAIVLALLTLNALRPFRKHPRLSMLSFLFGWLTSELALHHVAWQLVATILFVRAGALSSWQGWAGLAIMLANWTALVWDYSSGWQARMVMRAALDQALGPGWRDRIRPPVAAKIRRVAARQLLLPLPVTHPEVERTRNVCFWSKDRIRLRLDVHRHRSRPTNTPIMIYVHGGAWIIGDKSTQGLPILQHLAALGWTCFTVNYRLSPKATFPDHVVDVKRAIDWVRRNAAQYGGNPRFILISGGSAGAHLAALATLTSSDPAFQPGFEQADCHVDGCVGLFGVYDFADRAKAWPHLGMIKLVSKFVLKRRITQAPELFDSASPIFWARRPAPPFLLIHGTRDSVVPVAESRNLAAALRAASTSPVALAEIPGAQHAFDVFPSPRAVCVVEGVADFAMALYSQYLDRADSPAEAPVAPAPLATSEVAAGQR